MTDDNHDQPNEIGIERRAMLMRTLGIATVPILGLAGGSRLLAAAPAGDLPPLAPPTINERMAAVDICPVAAQAVEGPYYIDKRLVRTDVREGQAGKVLHLQVQVVNANRDCGPVKGVAVSVWQANALGYYSGYPKQKPDMVPEWLGRPMPPSAGYPASGHIESSGNDTFLRGIQTSDEQGMVNFTTVVPGWYTTRTPHIHAKLFMGSGEIANVQFYFPQALINAIFTQEAPYKNRFIGLYTNENDNVRRQSGLVGTQGLLSIRPRADGSLDAIARVGISHV